MGFDWVGSTENGLWEMRIEWVITEYWLYGLWVITKSTVPHLTVNVHPWPAG